MLALVLILSILSACSASFINGPQATLFYRCPWGTGLTSFWGNYWSQAKFFSVSSDRYYGAVCSQIGDKRTNSESYSPSIHWQSYLSNFQYFCPDEYTVDTLYSTYQSTGNSRAWQIGCRLTSQMRTRSCFNSGISAPKENFAFNADVDSAIAGMSSIHHNDVFYSDRRWYMRYCHLECDLDRGLTRIGTRICANIGLQVVTSARLLNNYQNSFYFQCAGNQIVSYARSVHHNVYEDRAWTFGCAESPKKNSITRSSFSGATYSNINGYFVYYCPSQHVLSGVRSNFIPVNNDRVFSFQCSRIANTALTGCYWTGWRNSFDGVVDFSVPYNYGIYGLQSEYSSPHRDRRFSFYVCRHDCVSGTQQAPDGQCLPPACSSIAATSAYTVSGACAGHIGNACTVTCATGQRAANGASSQTSTCESSGSWSPAPLQCAPVTCGRIANALMITTGACSGNFGDSCFHPFCIYTHLLEGGPYTRTCGYNGWTGHDPNCIAQSCGQRATPDNSVLSGSCSGGLSDVCTISCTKGHVMAGASMTLASPQSTSMCFFNWIANIPAAWTAQSLACNAAQCGALTLQNGQTSGACGGSFADECSYDVCDIEYDWADDGSAPTVRRCTVDGNTAVWTNTAPQCERVTCPALNVNFAVLTGSCGGTLYGQCNLACEAGYWPANDGQTSFTCELDPSGHSASWSANPASCKEVRCPVLRLENGATVGRCLGYIDQSCTYSSCAEGFVLSTYGSRTRTCVQDGPTAQWNGDQKICLKTIDTTAKQPFDIQCDDGYAFGGIFGAKDNANLIAHSFVCSPAGDIDAQRIYTRTVEAHQTTGVFDFSCPEGSYAISGAATSFEQEAAAANRIWTYECSIVAGADLIECRQEAGTYNFVNNFEFSVPPGRLITGFSSTATGGTAIRIETCKVDCRASDGYYETSPGKCERLRCPSVDFPNGFTEGDCEGRIGDVCRYTSCALGFQVSSAGNTERVCEIVDSTAQWSGVAKICEQITTTSAPTTTDACSGLRRSKTSNTCKNHCNMLGQDAMYFADYNGCTHVCTCGCRSDYRIARDATKCQEHCDTIDATLVGHFHERYDGCRGVCLCASDGVTPDEPTRRISTTPIEPASSDAQMTEFPFSRFGYSLEVAGSLTGVQTPRAYSGAFDDDTIVDIVDVTTVLQCMQACDAEALCLYAFVSRLAQGELQCRMLSGKGNLQATNSPSISLAKQSTSGSSSENLGSDPGVLETIAGDGSPAYRSPGEAQMPKNTGLNRPGYLGQVGPRFLLVPLISEHRVLMVNLFEHSFETIAGTGQRGNSGVGGSATAAQLNKPIAAVADMFGNVYITEEGNHRVSFIGVDARARLDVIIGTGKPGHRGMGGDGRSAQINEPRGLAIDMYGNLYVSDAANHVIYTYNTQTGVINLLAGNPGHRGFRVEDGSVSRALFDRPGGLAIHNGNLALFVADTDNNRIREIDIMNGAIATIAGAGPAGDGRGIYYDADGRKALFNHPEGVAVSEDGQFVLVTDTSNSALRVIDTATATNVVSHVLGSGHRAYNGDNQTPRSTRLNEPISALFTNNENAITFVDQQNRRVRRLWGGTGCFGCVQLPIKHCTASSAFNTDWSCEKTFDGDWSDRAGNAWATHGEGIGATITFNFGREVRVSHIGYQQRLNAAERFHQVRLTFSDGHQQTVELKNVQTRSRLTLHKTGPVRSVQMTAISVFGTINNGFTEIVFFGTEE